MDKPTLVLGGTGKTGRRVAERLQKRGLRVRIGSRGGAPPFDWNNQDTWAPALRDMGSAYVNYFPDLAVPGASATVGAFAQMAFDQGVRRLVLLSGRGEDGALLAEQAVQDSGADLTIIRASWFSQNFSEGSFRDQILSGVVALPAGDTKEPFIDADDIADVAVAALTEDGHVGQIYEVTGPRLLNFAQAIHEIGKATGRKIEFVPISVQQYAQVLEEHDLPADAVALISYLFTELLDGRNAHLSDGVERALGRPARDFSDYARDTAATGVWNEAQAGAATRSMA